MSSNTILFILSSAAVTLDGKPTGWYLPEAAHPYTTLAPHFDIEFASLKGPNPPLDPASAAAYEKDEDCAKFLADPVVQSKLANAKKLADVSPDDFIAILYVGGHGPVIDLPEDAVNIDFATKFYQSGKLTAAVCHGTAALANIKDKDGESIFKGKRFTGFSSEEEKLFGTLKSVPFMLEDKIVSLGGLFERADKPFGVKVVVDGSLYTGENPASAQALGEEMLKALKK